MEKIRKANGPVPILISMRKAIIADHYVAILTNRKNATLSVVATFQNPTFHQSKTYNLVFEPGEIKEIGGFEGWEVVPGETVQLDSDDYQSYVHTF